MCELYEASISEVSISAKQRGGNKYAKIEVVSVTEEFRVRFGKGKSSIVPRCQQNGGPLLNVARSIVVSRSFSASCSAPTRCSLNLVVAC